jgi:hypothetical protein
MVRSCQLQLSTCGMFWLRSLCSFHLCKHLLMHSAAFAEVMLDAGMHVLAALIGLSMRL